MSGVSKRLAGLQAGVRALGPSGDNAAVVGRLLLRAKSTLPHGNWLPWLADTGMPPRRAQRYMQLARTPAKCDSSLSYLSGTRAILASYTGDNEWFTPAEWIERARAIMGGIDLDPASCALAQQTVKAGIWYDKERDGLSQPWHGRIWLNPPYSRGLIGRFVDKLITEQANIEAAIVLVDNRTDTAWFQSLRSIAAGLAFTQGRIKFHNETKSGSPANGSVFFYCGRAVERFREVFGETCSYFPVLR